MGLKNRILTNPFKNAHLHKRVHCPFKSISCVVWRSESEQRKNDFYSAWFKLLLWEFKCYFCTAWVFKHLSKFEKCWSLQKTSFVAVLAEEQTESKNESKKTRWSLHVLLCSTVSYCVILLSPGLFQLIYFSAPISPFL